MDKNGLWQLFNGVRELTRQQRQIEKDVRQRAEEQLRSISKQLKKEMAELLEKANKNLVKVLSVPEILEALNGHCSFPLKIRTQYDFCDVADVLIIFESSENDGWPGPIYVAVIEKSVFARRSKRPNVLSPEDNHLQITEAKGLRFNLNERGLPKLEGKFTRRNASLVVLETKDEQSFGRFLQVYDTAEPEIIGFLKTISGNTSDCVNELTAILAKAAA